MTPKRKIELSELDMLYFQQWLDLTNWGQDKMADILQIDIFKCISLHENAGFFFFFF